MKAVRGKVAGRHHRMSIVCGTALLYGTLCHPCCVRPKFPVAACAACGHGFEFCVFTSYCSAPPCPVLRDSVSASAARRGPRRSRVPRPASPGSGVPVAVPVERSGPSAERSVVASRGELATRGCRLVASSEQGQVHVRCFSPLDVLYRRFEIQPPFRTCAIFPVFNYNFMNSFYRYRRAL